jgi:hypothetical protein
MDLEAYPSAVTCTTKEIEESQMLFLVNIAKKNVENYSIIPRGERVELIKKMVSKLKKYFHTELIHSES